MAIPKVIYQTFQHADFPLLTQWHIKNLQKRNSDYDYQFYDDERISSFMLSEYGTDIYNLYSRITIGAAKADLFRYAVLYKKGGIYLDIDSLNINKLNSFILPTDSAIISFENNLQFYVQWALVFEAGHPFLKRTLEIVLDNLRANKYPNDVHKMTGPSAFTQAVNECINELPNVGYRLLGIDYEGNFKFHYKFSKFFLYGVFRKNHWKNSNLKCQF